LSIINHRPLYQPPFCPLLLKTLTSLEFFTIDGKTICAITVEPSKELPVFVNHQDGKKFFVRAEASSQPVSDIEEIFEYWIVRGTELDI
jgi:hypothetical protein